MRLDLVQRSAVSEFETAFTRLHIPKDFMIFFGGAAIATLPALAPVDHPRWLVFLLIGEGALTLVSGIFWLARRPRVGRARTALTANPLTGVWDFNTEAPTEREGPAEQEQVTQSADTTKNAGLPSSGPAEIAEPPDVSATE